MKMPNLVDVTIKFNESDDTEVVTMCIGNRKGVNDEDVFYYVENVAELKSLCKSDNGNDFVITVAYHGTEYDTRKYPMWLSNDPKKAALFASYWGDKQEISESSKLLTCEITLTNPLYSTEWNLTEGSISKLQSDVLDNGYDSVIFTNPDDSSEIEYIIFNESQLNVIKEHKVTKDMFKAINSTSLTESINGSLVQLESVVV
jgi:hypothetical protein